MKYLEDNVEASTILVHNSINELNKAYNAANTTMNNCVNVFNLMSFNKFIENVVEEKHFDGTKGGATIDPMGVDQSAFMIGDLRSEDEKLSEALKIALDEVNAAKADKESKN